MRIVAGTYGGRRLQVPSGRDIRPTGDKVRGAMFNALEARGAVEGAHVLDCFCGTGALGLEALSRGAEFCTFWDNDKRSLELTKTNAKALDVLEQCAFHLQDAAKVKNTSKERKYSLVFLDAPYCKDLILPAIQGLQSYSLLVDGAVCVIEAEKDFEPNLSGSFEVQSEKIYGDTKVLTVQFK